MRLHNVLIIFLFSCFLFGFYDYRGEIGYENYVGMGYVAPKGAFWANPARLGLGKGLNAGLSFCRWWGVKELDQVAFSGIYARNNNGFGILFSSFGSSNLYLENLFSVGYGRKITRWFSAGGGIEYLYLSLTDEFGSKGTVGIDLGMIFNPEKKVYLGLTCKGINRLSLGGNELSPLLAGAIFFNPTTWYELALSVEKEEHKNGIFKLNQNVILYDLLHLSFGLRGEPTSFFFGTSFDLKNFTFNFTYLRHPDLKSNTMFTLEYYLGK